MTPFQRKVAAAQATLDAFRERPHRFGRSDCARMVAAHLRRLGWSVKLPPSGSYSSARSARKELDARGYSSLSDAIDAFGFERIVPAMAVAGDIVELPSGDDLGALTVCLGNSRVVGYHPDQPAGAAVLQPVQFVAAWRVTPA